ncbi:MAG: response regulator [Magnetococcales bacterium]|nr:response regulator [Magnetococcales bacterium]
MDILLTDDKLVLPKVLLVDDDPSSLFTFIAFLNGHCNVDTAENGIDALIKLKSNHYNMVFIDIMMPQMDGLTTIKKFREWEGSDKNVKRTPIAVLTAMAFEKDKEASYCAGCDLYLTKPIERKLLLESLHSYADCTFNITQNQEQVHDSMEEFLFDDQGDPILNLQYIKKLVASLKPDKLFFVVDTFSSTGEVMVEQIERFAASNNLEAMVDTSHKMKGMAIHLGMEKLSGLVADIQQYAESGDSEIVVSIVKDLKPLFDRSLESLNKAVFNIKNSRQAV